MSKQWIWQHYKWTKLWVSQNSRYDFIAQTGTILFWAILSQIHDMDQIAEVLQQATWTVGNHYWFTTYESDYLSHPCSAGPSSSFKHKLWFSTISYASCKINCNHLTWQLFHYNQLKQWRTWRLKWEWVQDGLSLYCNLSSCMVTIWILCNVQYVHYKFEGCYEKPKGCAVQVLYMTWLLLYITTVIVYLCCGTISQRILHHLVYHYNSWPYCK